MTRDVGTGTSHGVRRWQCWRCKRDILVTPRESGRGIADQRDLPKLCPYCGEDPRTIRTAE